MVLVDYIRIFFTCGNTFGHMLYMSGRIYIILVHGRKRRPKTRGLCFGKKLRKAESLAWKELNIVQLIKGCKGML